MTDRIFIALTLFMSILLMGILGGTVNAVALQRAEEQRLQAVTADLRARLEIDLRVGLSLTDNERAQTMLENAVAQTALLESVEIDSAEGKVLYSSDRGLQGQPVPASWRDAMQATAAGWRVSSKGEHSIGTALRDAAGQIAGYLVSTHQAGQGEDAVTLPMPVFWIALAAALLYLVAGRLTERLQNDSQDATSVIEEARSELERVNREANRIAGLET
jgi:phage gp36-like protein